MNPRPVRLTLFQSAMIEGHCADLRHRTPVQRSRDDQLCLLSLPGDDTRRAAFEEGLAVVSAGIAVHRVESPPSGLNPLYHT